MARVERKAIKLGKVFQKIIPGGYNSFPIWTAPIVLLVVTVLSYGLYANQLGFYWDDWGFAWTRLFRGLDGLKLMFGVNRPMRAYFEAAFTPFLGVNPFAWQICSMFMRWLAAVALWWLLRQVWPPRTRPIFMVALFYIVYPGFSQQPLAMTYYYFWFFQAVFFFSLGLMVWGIRTPKYFRPAMLAALALTAAHLFSSEYLFGLELLRPIFLWLALAVMMPDLKKRLGRTALYYAPFIFVTGVYLYWRIFVFKFHMYQPGLLRDIQSSPAQSVIQLVRTAVQSLPTVSLQAWLKILQIPNITEGGALFKALYPWLVIGSMIALIVYQSRLRARNLPGTAQETASRGHAWQFIGIGIIAILVAGIPYYVTLLPVRLTFPEDRFTMSYLVGVSLLLAGLLELLPDFSQSITLASVLAALAIGLNFHTAYLYRNERDLQKTFLWQLTWRAPALQPDTLILSDDKTFPYTDDEGLSFPLNWTYAPKNLTDRFSYALFTISGRLGIVLPSLESSVPVQKSFLSATFSGDTDKVLVIYYAPPSCLRVLDPAYDASIVSVPVTWDIAGQPLIEDIRFLPRYTLQALPLADVGRIIPDPVTVAEPPAFMFAPEPKHNWCYLFEKADLARQTGNWEKIARLGDEAADQFYYPNDLSEYLVFIEAYARLGRWQDARDYSKKVARWAPVLTPLLCEIWQRAEQPRNLSADDRALAAEAKHELRCPAP